ncbi:MAG: phosphate ABC transporter permease PstA [Nitrososphaerota archaeon]|jgi:phosphate transport system permease protein|nr:phosphate ABC transporter permease PstA [Nitrososphaerota archaeon]
MEVFLLSWMDQLYTYIKNRDRNSLFAGALIFIPGIVFTIFALYQTIIPINEYITQGMPWDHTIDRLAIDIFLNILLFTPALIMFVAAYLQAESNQLGFKVCFALSIGALGGLIFNLADPTLLIISMTFSILATIVGLEESKKNKHKKYSPIIVEKIAILGLRLSSIIAIAVLVGIIAYVVLRGAQFLSWEFITADNIGAKEIVDQIVSGDPRSIGGIRIFIIGSLILVGYCEAIAIPLGIGAAIYLAEYAPKNKFIDALRFFIETLAGAPSIVIGLFGFAYFVRMLGMGVSIAAGGLALAIMILPWNIRTAEEAMRAVPQSYREASYALGATKWQTIKRTVLLSASPAAITGIVLGFGAAIGETAVIMLTASYKGTNVFPDNISLIGAMGNPSLGGHDIPTLQMWIMNAYYYIAQGTNRPSGTINWQLENVMFSGALVLLIIFIGISFVALILRNYLAKKTHGAR